MVMATDGSFVIVTTAVSTLHGSAKPTVITPTAQTRKIVMIKHVKWKTLKEFRSLPEALREIERLRVLVAELLPVALNDAEQGVSIGLPPEGNEFCDQCDQTCDDCTWYNQSIIFFDKYNSGYYQ